MPLATFINELAKNPAPSILELGSKRVEGNPSTLRKDWVPHAAEHIGVDFQEGLDVDVVGDIHKLSQVFPENRFDGIISCSTFEHIQYPWIAAVEICRVLKPGGLFFVQTHHTFPLHAFPYDYWRFSEDGLKTLFAPQIGFELLASASEFPCEIVSERVPDAVNYPSYLNVVAVVRKVAHPPSNYVWRAE